MNDVLITSAITLFGALMIVLNWIAAKNPDIWESHLVDWYKPDNFAVPEVKRRRHALFRVGHYVGASVGLLIFLVGLGDLVEALSRLR